MDEVEMSPATVAMYDQIMAKVRDLYPHHSIQWREVWVTRMWHAEVHDGDMTGAPPWPEGEPPRDGEMAP